MNVIWTIEINSGSRASLVANGVRRQVWRPLTMRMEDFHRLLPQGSIIDEKALLALLNIWE